MKDEQILKVYMIVQFAAYLFLQTFCNTLMKHVTKLSSLKSKPHLIYCFYS